MALPLPAALSKLSTNRSFMRKHWLPVMLCLLLLAGFLLAGKDVYYQINQNLCWQCGRCILVCPTHAAHTDTTTWQVVIDPALCTGCGLCLSQCPHNAIYSVTGNDDESIPVPRLSLTCFPNPSVHPALFWKLTAGQPAATLKMYDIKGHLVTCFPLNNKTSGSLTWNALDKTGKPLPSGVYLAELSCGNNRITKKITVVHP